MLIAADTHVHRYPGHDLRAVLENGFRNLTGLAAADKNEAAAARVLCLTEGAGFHAFRALRDGADPLPEGWRARVTAEQDSLVLERGAATLYLVAGRQIVTAERLEVLALAADADLEEGRALSDTLEAARAAGAVPVLSWAPGKWFGARGHAARRAIDNAVPGDFLLGDTTMRPTVWPEPVLMRAGRRLGLGVVAGSDPLPPPGEERWIGTYGIVADAAFDAERPADSLRRLLRGGDWSLRGRRCGPLEMLRRWNRHRAAKKGAA